MHPLPEAKQVQAVRRGLLGQYRRQHRDLPWRRQRDPYAIWVSEIMLQQTQVDTVVPRYEAFLQRYPTVGCLAAASELDVCEAWAGLGYYRRARHLHAAARQIMEHHGGALPADVKSLMSLPGIGRYTAGAIASIAFGQPAPLVDGNVARVLSRVFTITDGVASPAGQKRLWALAEAMVHGESPGDLNQALMEQGAQVCTPTAPRCLFCAVRESCGAYGLGTVQAFPVVKVKAPRVLLPMAMVWSEGKGGVWLSRRPLDGLWAGLWELPSAAGDGAAQALATRLGQKLGGKITTIKHTLTHRDVVASVYRVAKPRWCASETLRPWSDPLQAGLSALARKAIAAVRSSP